MDMYRSLTLLKEIRVFIKRHVVVCILLLLSIFTVAKCSRIPAPNWLPAKITQILLRPLEGTPACEWLELLYNFSLAYIASIITYVVVQYIPERKKAYKSFDILKKEILSMYADMSRIISMYLYEIGVERKEKRIAVQDLTKICEVEISDKDKACKIENQRNGGKGDSVSFSYNLYKYSKKYGDAINKSIKQIKETICSGQLDPDIIEIISGIENSRFLQIIKYLDSPITSSFERKTIIFNFDKSFYEFIKYHHALSAYNYDLVTYKFSKMSDEEIRAEYENRLFMAPSIIYKYKGASKATTIADEITVLPPTEERLEKSVIVLLNMLQYYDSDEKRPKGILDAASKIAEYVLHNETDEAKIVIAFLNAMQIKRRQRTLTSEDLVELYNIAHDSNNPDIIIVGASIIYGDYNRATTYFERLTDEEKDSLSRFPVYSLWQNPPVEATPIMFIYNNSEA